MTQDALAIVLTISETIRELREVPSGHLFTALQTAQPSLSLQSYQTIIESLKRCKLVSERAHLLTWIGPHGGEIVPPNPTKH